MVERENIDSGYPNLQLDTRSSGSRRNLDYLLIRRTLTIAPRTGASPRGCQQFFRSPADLTAQPLSGKGVAQADTGMASPFLSQRHGVLDISGAGQGPLVGLEP
jgi:hypothetical protein